MKNAKKAPARKFRSVVVETKQSHFLETMMTLEGDPRRKRFMVALKASLPHMLADDMDKIEPLLVTVIGRDKLAALNPA